MTNKQRTKIKIDQKDQAHKILLTIQELSHIVGGIAPPPPGPDSGPSEEDEYS